MLRKQILMLVLFALGIKVLYLLISVPFQPGGIRGSLFEQYVSVVKKNDANWYKEIALEGYDVIHEKRDLGYAEGVEFKQSNWAFFPFYPLLNAGTIKILKVSYNQSAVIWSLIFSLTAVLGIFWFGFLFYQDQSLAFFNVLVLFSFPFSFYYSMLYTEALFLTFLIFSFLCIYYRQYGVLALLLIPLTLVRPNGIIMLIPLYLYSLEQHCNLQRFKVNWDAFFSQPNLLRSLAFISAPITFLAYCFYQYQHTGYFFAFSIAQAGWYRKFTFPLFTLLGDGSLTSLFNSCYTLVFIFFAWLIRKKIPVSFNVLILVGLLLPLSTGLVGSMPRFISVLFPLFLILSSYLYRLRYKYLVLFLIFLLHGVSFLGWVLNHRISY